MTEHLQNLLDAARNIVLTPEQKGQQRAGWPTLSDANVRLPHPSWFSKSGHQNRELNMTEHLQDLLEAAKNVALTPEEKEQQRRSFAYGNVAIENPRITREMVDRAADTLPINYLNADSSTRPNHS